MDWVIFSSILVAFAALFTAGVVLITAIFAYRQLEETAKAAIAIREATITNKEANETNAFLNLVRIVQNEEIRKARRHLLHKLKNKKYINWTDEDKEIVEKACHPYDSIGIMVESGFIKKDLVLKWDRSIIKIWDTAKPMIHDYRKTRNDPGFWIDFENLYKKAKKL